FTYSLTMVLRAMQAVIYGDVLMRVVYRTRPYEKEPGSVNALHEKWKQRCIADLTAGGLGMMQ
ncbi:MAG: 2-hydroxyglutaryl-CoA dehydratase, partial [Lachnospiraceae bacterium]|nr:2-hydroxyglutaryl-CoA dehydratase [Lachnospiraceae bacterium]